ncbi:MAG: hypothetical protein BMS9Abin37_0493 [Acidobacteriota bacterium]|nr:MAG: hypothetical protein BMS9Abin37_0493 [Acidobacteriota bacterium]
MKLKTSITLSEDVVKQLDALAETGESRSQVIERMLREGFAELERHERDLRDLELINCNADKLNEEAEDVLSYQVEF